MIKSHLTGNPWQSALKYTGLYNYRNLEKQIIKTYSPYVNMISEYSRISKHDVSLITNEYLKQNQEVSIQNVVLLKNAIQLWNDALQTSDTVAARARAREKQH